MAKPILVIGISYDFITEFHENMEDQLKLKINDYHVLVYPHNREDFEFKVLNGKEVDDYDVKDIEEIKRFISEKMEVNKKYNYKNMIPDIDID